ncbi:septum formation protein [Spirosomataceae bacterium TFI 002]|nr:septum formation protein [Spirosomataceae bacterium TFI 002]
MPLKLSKRLILASNSPRRREIMENAGFVFSKEVRETDENFSERMDLESVASYLAEQKAKEFLKDNSDAIVLCADTVVICDGEIMNKPQDAIEAQEMLLKLSGKAHEVITGVAILLDGEIESFSDKTIVTFKHLNNNEIEYYIQECKPYDKAGGYGIQEFIGMIAIEKLEGSFYTVMGLPIHKVYEKLKPYLLF